ncbi:MAG: HAD family phosphatase [Lachnospiraceae bacterium]|nr:HAD family phosphatase [Lachnospiraceae bacterium]
MLTDISAVLFDLDGTLVDSMWMWKQIDIEYLGRKNIPMPEDLQRSIEGRSFYETAVYFRERFGLKDDTRQIMDEWNSMAAEMYGHRVSLKRGVRRFLEYLKNNGYKTGISTSNSKYLTDIALNAHGLGSCFDCIRAGCNEISGKPAPDVYLLSAADLGVEPEKCLVFEDLVAGIMAGKAAGMKVCAVWDDFSDFQLEEKKSLADYYIQDYYELLEDIESKASGERHS